MSSLYRMHPDGSGVEQLTRYLTEALRATQPRYSPDGTSNLLPETRGLWVIPADGGEPIVIVSGGIYTQPARQPLR